MPFKFPRIDYAAHPYYQIADGDELHEAHAAPGLRERVVERAQNILASEQRLALARTGPGGQADEFSRDGFATFALGKDRLAKLKVAAAPYVSALQQQRNAAPLGQLDFRTTVLPVDEGRTSEIYELIEDSCRDLGLVELASAHVGLPMRIRFVHLQMDRAEDQYIQQKGRLDGALSPAFYLHIDAKTMWLKIMVYLQDTDEENGALRYIVGSHDSDMTPYERAVRRANDALLLDNTDPKTRAAFARLPPELQHKCNFGNDLFGEEAERVLQAERLVEAPGGTAILFDISGAHRGAILHKGERQVLQITLEPAI